MLAAQDEGRFRDGGHVGETIPVLVVAGEGELVRPLHGAVDIHVPVVERAPDRRRPDVEPADMAMVENGHRRLIGGVIERSEEHTYELQSLMRNSYAVFCLKKKKKKQKQIVTMTKERHPH